MKKFISIKKIGISLVVMAAVLCSFAVTSFATYVNSTGSLQYGGHINFVNLAPVADNWSDGWKTELVNERTGEIKDVTERTTFGLNDAKTQTKISFMLNLDEYNEIYTLKIYNEIDKLVTSSKMCYMSEAFAAGSSDNDNFADKYMKDINVYNDTVKIVPDASEEGNVKFYENDVQVNGAMGNSLLLDGVTKAYYLSNGKCSVEYSVSGIKGGEYEIYFYDSGVKSMYGATDTNVSVVGDEFNTGTIKKGGTDPKVVKIGRFNLKDGDNKIILSKENATNKDRLYAGDIWLVPVTTSKSRYAGVDVEAVEFWNSSTKELDAFNGDEKVFKAIVYYNAYGHESTENEKMSIIGALYDENEVLLNTVIMPDQEIKTNPYGATQNKRVTYNSNSMQLVIGNLNQYPTAAKARLFVWDSLGNIVPITNVTDINKIQTAE